MRSRLAKTVPLGSGFSSRGGTYTRRHDLAAAGLVREGPSDKLGILDVIARGERAREDRRVVSHEAARKRMARWLK